MTINHAGVPRKPLRLWPGVVAAALQWLIWLVMPAFFPQWGGEAIIGGLLLGLVIVVWWLFFSRARWAERLGALALIIAAVAVTSRLVHESIANGMMGFMVYIYAIPAVTLALVVWAVASRGLTGGLRYASLLASVLVACAALAAIRTEGLDGNADSDLHWRWTPTAEQRLLARTRAEMVPVTPPPPAAAPAPEEPPAAPPPAGEPGPPPTIESEAGRGQSGRIDGRVVRLSRTRARRRRSRRTHPDRLVRLSTCSDVAAADWTRLVILRRSRRLALYPGTAR